MGAKNVKKNVIEPAVLAHALAVLKKAKVEKVFVTKSGYVFVKESDARAFVGKDGAYFPVTENSQAEFGVSDDPLSDAPENKTAKVNKPVAKKSDKLIDEHKKEGDEQGTKE